MPALVMPVFSWPRVGTAKLGDAGPQFEARQHFRMGDGCDHQAQ